MKRKLSIVVTVLAIILSISFVAFMGVKGRPAPQTIRVDRIAFIDEEGEEIKRNRVNYEKGVEIMSVRYKVYPEEATNKDISIYFFDYGKESNVTCLKSLTQEGVIDIDFKGDSLDQFYIRITSLDSAGIEASLRFVGKD